MFGTIIKGFIPEPRQPDQPRHYIGRHRTAQALRDASAEPRAASSRDDDTHRQSARHTGSQPPGGDAASRTPAQDPDVDAYRRAG